MKVSGFTFVRNAVKYDYPVKEAISSVLPLCDEFIVCLGHSDDETEALVRSLKSDKIRIIPSVWDDSLREGGRVEHHELPEVLLDRLRRDLSRKSVHGRLDARVVEQPLHPPRAVDREADELVGRRIELAAVAPLDQAEVAIDHPQRFLQVVRRDVRELAQFLVRAGELVVGRAQRVDHGVEQRIRLRLRKAGLQHPVAVVVAAGLSGRRGDDDALEPRRRRRRADLFRAAPEGA